MAALCSNNDATQGVVGAGADGETFVARRTHARSASRKQPSLSGDLPSFSIDFSGAFASPAAGPRSCESGISYRVIGTTPGRRHRRAG